MTEQSFESARRSIEQGLNAALQAWAEQWGVAVELIQVKAGPPLLVAVEHALEDVERKAIGVLNAACPGVTPQAYDLGILGRVVPNVVTLRTLTDAEVAELQRLAEEQPRAGALFVVPNECVTIYVGGEAMDLPQGARLEVCFGTAGELEQRLKDRTAQGALRVKCVPGMRAWLEGEGRDAKPIEQGRTA